jgi:hypothetical protein
MALALHAKNSARSWSEAPIARLAGWTGLSTASVKRGLKELETAGWIVRHRLKRKSGANAATRHYLVSPLVDEADDELTEPIPGSDGATTSGSEGATSSEKDPRKYRHTSGGNVVVALDEYAANYGRMP